ncbi:hypothetical protein, partial [Chitinophaga sp.]|uniref:hypothetical protein n=1 Tax=Chitinophaga sp. TaxID=1869181 RepID=UPI002FDD21A2
NSYNNYGSMTEVNYLLLAKQQGWVTDKEADDRIQVLRNTNTAGQLEDHYFRHQFNQQHNISLSGGSEKNSLNAALRYITNENNSIGNN